MEMKTTRLPPSKQELTVQYPMARVSFGSRAGGSSDYLSGANDFQYRQPTLNGQYNSLTDLTNALRAEIDACTASEVPELTTCELSISESATLPLLRPTIGPYADGGEHDLPPEFKSQWTAVDGSEHYPGLTTSLPKATVKAILAVGSGQPKQIAQRAASRAIVQAIEATDGFKYSFNNAWAAKDEGGLRFSYICQDSMQNKDRHANGFTKTQKHLKGEGERGPRKPTYDCKGSVSVKFSGIRRRVDVYYRHYAIHSTVADRKPPSRPVGRPRKEQVGGDGVVEGAMRQQDTGGLLETLQSEESAFTAQKRAAPPPLPAARMESSNISLPKKRKRESDSIPQPPRDPSKPLSLAELLRQSEDASTNFEKDAKPKNPTSYVPPPVEYSLPSWQAPPPPPPPPPLVPPHAPLQQQSTPQYPPWSSSPYPPPYQPQQYQPPLQPTQPNRSQPPVAIPRAPSQPKQEYLGPPGPHPQSQGLFSTLKPVRKEEYTTYEPHFVIYQGNRAKTSCHHCRISKKKCDEGRPMCGACARTGKLDCLYEGAPSRAPMYSLNQAQVQQYPQQYPQPPPVQAPLIQSAASSQTFAASQSQPSQPLQQTPREESPDPWFPRR